MRFLYQLPNLNSYSFSSEQSSQNSQYMYSTILYIAKRETLVEIFLKNSEQRAPTEEEISLVLNGVLRALTLTHPLALTGAHTHIHTYIKYTHTCKVLSIQPIQSEIAQLQLETRSQPQRPKPETKQHTKKRRRRRTTTYLCSI